MDRRRIMSLEEARTLRETWAQIHTPNGRLTDLVIRLGLDAGLRVGEICRVRVEDLYLDGPNPYIHVERSKRLKNRDVRIPDSLKMALKRYVTSYRPQSDRPEVLISVNTGQPLSPRGVELRFKTALKRAGLRTNLVPHSMRHTFATRALEKGKTLAWVRDQLGHDNIATTSVYLGVANLIINLAVELY